MTGVATTRPVMTMRRDTVAVKEMEQPVKTPVATTGIVSIVMVAVVRLVFEKLVTMRS